MLLELPFPAIPTRSTIALRYQLLFNRMVSKAWSEFCGKEIVKKQLTFGVERDGSYLHFAGPADFHHTVLILVGFAVCSGP